MKAFLSIVLFLWLTAGVGGVAQAQQMERLVISYDQGIRVTGVKLTDGRELSFARPLPLFTLRMNGVMYSSAGAEVLPGDTAVRFVFDNGVTGIYTLQAGCEECAGMVMIRNSTNDTMRIENLVPLGEDRQHLFLTAGGPPSLTRARLFIPGRSPVGVVLPDNAWELGYASVPLDDSFSASLLARRGDHGNSTKMRYATRLSPRGWVGYRLYAGLFSGPWQNGLREVFHGHYLYDLPSFVEAL